MKNSKMKFVFIFFVISVLVVFVSGCRRDIGGLTQKKGILTIGMEIGYPPMEYYDENGNPDGFDVKMAEEIGKRIGLQIDIIDTAWDSILEGLDARRYDCVISSVSINPERYNLFNISKPYIQNKLTIVLPRNSRRRVSSPQDLGGLGVAFQEKTTSEDFMMSLEAEGLRFTPYAYDKVMYCFDDLRLGRVDAIMTDIVVAYEYLARSDFFDIVWQGGEDEFGVFMKKGNDALTDAINKALDELFEDGTMQKISKEYFNGMDLVSDLRK